MTTALDLLRGIQEGATSDAMSVSELLRRCQVFAARARVQELGDWVKHELNGYPADAELPEYRIFHGRATGHFMGPYQSGYKNVPLPVSNLPDDRRDWG